MIMLLESLPPIAGILALLFAFALVLRIRKRDRGNAKMREISDLVYMGALSYLKSQYKVITVFVLAVAAVLTAIPGIGLGTALAFLTGAFLSGVSGNIGMRVATSANSRTAQGCMKSLNSGLRIAFSSGAVMGMTVVGLGLLGVTAAYLAFGDVGVLFGFGFGASSIALFARVGGGIYTKAADVGADLVGKIEAGIPEDDPRNPAVIADNVGDNVGDVAGMGADLFESYVDSIIATMAIGIVAFGLPGLWLPMVIAGVGILASILGTFFVWTKDGKRPGSALNRGIFAAAVIMAIASYFVVGYVLGPGHSSIYVSLLSGLIGGVAIGLVTQYYTTAERDPTKDIAEAAQTGAGTNVITGLAVGMESAIVPVLVVCGVIFVSYSLAGLYGIAVAAVGMLSTLGITLATDTYGPVADNAAGIAEMADLGPGIRKRAEALDAVGNTTAAIGKGFAIGSAALTALALFSVYSAVTGLDIISVTNPYVLIGLFIGALLPLLFSSFTMRAVGKTASKIVREVRRQFREIKGIMDRKGKADYDKCIDISTSAALREMVAPSMLAVVSPIIVGLLLGAEALGGMLAGALATGFMLALMMANAGGAWDNAKKYIEAGHLGGKGSDAHKAAVVGDTVGDPFKDTSGPSLNILIKLMCIVALVFAPLFL